MCKNLSRMMALYLVGCLAFQPLPAFSAAPPLLRHAVPLIPIFDVQALSPALVAAGGSSFSGNAHQDVMGWEAAIAAGPTVPAPPPRDAATGRFRNKDTGNPGFAKQFILDHAPLRKARERGELTVLLYHEIYKREVPAARQVILATIRTLDFGGMEKMGFLRRVGQGGATGTTILYGSGDGTPPITQASIAAKEAAEKKLSPQAAFAKDFILRQPRLLEAARAGKLTRPLYTRVYEKVHNHGHPVGRTTSQYHMTAFRELSGMFLTEPLRVSANTKFYGLKESVKPVVEKGLVSKQEPETGWTALAALPAPAPQNSLERVLEEVSKGKVVDPEKNLATVRDILHRYLSGLMSLNLAAVKLTYPLTLGSLEFVEAGTTGLIAARMAVKYDLSSGRHPVQAYLIRHWFKEQPDNASFLDDLLRDPQVATKELASQILEEAKELFLPILEARKPWDPHSDIPREFEVTEHVDETLVSPDGRWLAVVNNTGPREILIIEIATRKILGRVTGFSLFESLAFHPKSHLLVITGWTDAKNGGHSLALWRLGGSCHEFQRYDLKEIAGIRTLAFSPDGETLLLADRNGLISTLKLNYPFGLQLGKFYQFKHLDISAVAYDPTGTFVAEAGNSSGVINVLDADLSGIQKRLCPWTYGRRTPVQSLAWHPNGKVIAAVMADCKWVNIVDVETERTLQTIFTDSLPSSVAFTADGRLLAIGFNLSTHIPVRFYDYQAGMTSHGWWTPLEPDRRFPGDTERSLHLYDADLTLSQTGLFASHSRVYPYRAYVHQAPSLPPAAPALQEPGNKESRPKALLTSG